MTPEIMPRKASDIPDQTVLDVLTHKWQCEWDVAEHFPGVHPKILHAKLSKLAKRGLIHGCDCGCRGDWHLPRHPDRQQCGC
jgi:hypothetical protein